MNPTKTAAAPERRRLFVYNGGFLTQGRVRRILTLAGYDIRLGAPGPDDLVGVWGKSPTSVRGETVAQHSSSRVIHVEDAFLRSVKTGRDGAPPLGLLIDADGVHFASGTPSALERLLASDPLDDTALLDRARSGMARLQSLHLSKYNGFDPALPAPAPGYVLIIDQTKGDASIEHGGATGATLREMLFVAQDEHPAARIVIRTHPETDAGHRQGHYTMADAIGRISLCSSAVSPYRLLEGAIAVYTVSSQMGFEAILRGHKPRVFGQPFYAGWGLSDDQYPVWRRKRKLTRAQLFAAAMILYPTWYDPCRDRLCSFEQALDQLEAETRAFREDRDGYVALGMRPWKRGTIQRFFGGEKQVRFERDRGRAVARAKSEGRKLMVWASAATPALLDRAAGAPLTRVEDGFLRSRGLGAELVQPLSLVADLSGIYYDPTSESTLERLIATPIPPAAAARAQRLIAALRTQNINKYNLRLPDLPPLPDGHKILVPGQVEDDASIRFGASQVCTNLALLAEVRARNPQATILYKPHPDVERGLRPGALQDDAALTYADLVIRQADPARLLAEVSEVWTITSGLGFEALIRGLPVTCFGAPFYAGWGLTTDLGPVPSRRSTKVDLAAMVHAALITYPRYVDPVTGLPCPVEVAVERLVSGTGLKQPARLRLAAKVQGWLSGALPIWR